MKLIYFALVAVLAAALVAAYLLKSQLWGSTLQASVPRSDNVVVILIDTLRADHLKLYDYDKETAPYITSLGERSKIFDTAISSCSSTAPATSSIFTSLLPSEHGVITGQVATRRLLEKNPEMILNRIPESLETMPEYFKSRGYATFSVADNLNIAPEMGFAQGFDHFRTFWNEGADHIEKTLKEWQPLLDSSKPYFLYIHFMDPHSPYLKRKPWFEPSKDKKQRTLNAYDSEISYVDATMQRLSEMFGWEENALVVVLADHGEEFWDHGDIGHGMTLYREVIRVPFLFFHRSFDSGRIAPEVHTMDLMPTLADLLGFEKISQWRGRSLVPLMEGAEQEAVAAFSQLLRRPEHLEPPKKSVVHEGLHLINTLEPESEKHELYDLHDDPKQLSDLSQSYPAQRDSLLRMIEAREQTLTHVETEETKIAVNDETLRQLETLGYLK
ncbi:MAG: hypothetical protein DCC75_02180 [Proteobacteria bacterium]|nr:MAG: hypothetical protein DCC75_02180 [Pseudomonadota bacterium]